MTPEQHKRASVIFNELRELSGAELAKALEAACAGDGDLRARVLRLLDADQQAADGSFLGRRALEDAARLLVPDFSSLPSPGTLIGTYRLGSRIGTGGMGVVYEAEDQRLPRRVAIKVLPPQSFGMERKERIQRFEREARTASQLNHPHIVSILDAAFDHGFYYIAMEFVEGRTLRTLIEQESRMLDAKTVLDLVSQVASALSAAHEAGIVHRDIKPENIMLRPDGFVKVLDFGLASVREASSNPTDLRTRPGHLPGTIQYLSPEQVMGRPATPRSDLFSLGIVSYEVATGVRPFDGATDGLIFEAILNHPPAPPSVVRSGLGTELDSMILRLLEKDPDLRFQTASDLRSCCKQLSRDSSSPRLKPVVRGGRRMGVRMVAVASVAAAASAGLMWLLGTHTWTVVPLLPYRFEQLTDSSGEEKYPSLSADGKQFVYASPRNGKWDIFVQRTGGRTNLNLTKDSRQDDTQPVLSPDGSQIAFRSERDGGGLFVMEATGENPRRVATQGYLPAWSPDSRRLVYSTHSFTSPQRLSPPPSELHIVSLADNSEGEIKTSDAIQPAWSPHGFRIAYWGISEGGRRDIFTVPASGNGRPVAVTSDAAVDWNPIWAPSGKQLYFLSDRGGSSNIWRIAIDERSGKSSSAPEPVTVPAENVGSLAIAGDGKSLIYSQSSQSNTLWRIAFDPVHRVAMGKAERLGEGQTVSDFSFSPDGTQLVYDTIGDRSENLWIMKADGSARRRLTSDAYRNRAPAWSPQGDEILFYSDRSGHYDEWVIRPDGSGLRPLTNGARLSMQDGAWSPDGKRILAGRFDPILELDAQAKHPVTIPREAAAIHQVSGLFCRAWTNGPDGSLSSCDFAGRPFGYEPTVYSPSQRKLEHTGLSGRSTHWAPSASLAEVHRALIFADGSQCMLYDRVMKRAWPLFSVAPNTIIIIAGDPNHQYLYFSQNIGESDLWLASLGR